MLLRELSCQLFYFLIISFCASLNNKPVENFIRAPSKSGAMSFDELHLLLTRSNSCIVPKEWLRLALRRIRLKQGIILCHFLSKLSWIIRLSMWFDLITGWLTKGFILVGIRILMCFYCSVIANLVHRISIGTHINVLFSRWKLDFFFWVFSGRLFDYVLFWGIFFIRALFAVVFCLFFTINFFLRGKYCVIFLFLPV